MRAWTRRADRDLHLVVDEIFAGCDHHRQIDGRSKSQDQSFNSIASLSASKGLGEKTTIVWGIAKDFGLGGHHLGFDITRYVTNVDFQNIVLNLDSKPHYCRIFVHTNERL